MTTKRAPKTWGRGRRLVLAGVFSVALVTIFAQAVPAIAAPPARSKGNGNAHVNSKASPECTTSEGSGAANVENSAKSDEPKTDNGKHTRQGSGAAGSGGNAGGNSTQNGSSGSGSGSGSGTSSGSSGPGPSNVSNVEKDNGPCTSHKNTQGVGHDGHNGWGFGHNGSKETTPPGYVDKYNGPCTSHENTQGVGHDGHNGWGHGHDGTRTVTPCDDGDDDGDDDDTDVTPSTNPTPSVNPTQTPAPTQNPTGDDGPKKDPITGEPYMPFVEPTSNKVVDKTTDEFLPFTGGELDYLLAVAACAALAGTKLRFASRRRYEARRRAR